MLACDHAGHRTRMTLKWDNSLLLSLFRRELGTRFRWRLRDHCGDCSYGWLCVAPAVSGCLGNQLCTLLRCEDAPKQAPPGIVWRINKMVHYIQQKQTRTPRVPASPRDPRTPHNFAGRMQGVWVVGAPPPHVHLRASKPHQGEGFFIYQFGLCTMYI